VELDDLEIARVCNYTKWKLCESFFARHGRWPDVEILEGAPDRLRSAHTKGKWVTDQTLSITYPAVSIEGWTFCTILEKPGI